jgi:hypothetical protein
MQTKFYVQSKEPSKNTDYTAYLFENGETKQPKINWHVTFPLYPCSHSSLCENDQLSIENSNHNPVLQNYDAILIRNIMLNHDTSKVTVYLTYIILPLFTFNVTTNKPLPKI